MPVISNSFILLAVGQEHVYTWISLRPRGSVTEPSCWQIDYWSNLPEGSFWFPEFKNRKFSCDVSLRWHQTGSSGFLSYSFPVSSYSRCVWIQWVSFPPDNVMVIPKNTHSWARQVVGGLAIWSNKKHFSQAIWMF